MTNTTTGSGPILGKIRTTRGVAGQIAYAVAVTYPDEPAHMVQFVGSVYGDSVVMITPFGAQTFVVDPSRFGKFGAEWVRRFFA